MKSPRDDNDEPSEITEAFRAPDVRLPPVPGTYQILRGRATARRRRRVAAVAASVVVCLAGTTMAVLSLTPSDDGGSDSAPLASEQRDASADPDAGSSASASEEPAGEASEEPTTEVDSPDPSPRGSDDPDPVESAPATCDVSQLELTDGPADSGAGSVYFSLRFSNTSDSACSLTGYPGVSLVADGFEQVGAAATRSDQGGDPERVVLEPGETAQSDVRLARAENYPVEDCAPVETDGLLVYPPDETESLFISYNGLIGCANPEVTLLEVQVVHEP